MLSKGRLVTLKYNRYPVSKGGRATGPGGANQLNHYSNGMVIGKQGFQCGMGGHRGHKGVSGCSSAQDIDRCVCSLVASWA